ncbi:MAG: hypothetical protein AAFW70_12605 [Cyanobacteria bacterium J06635_10]
MNTIKNSMRLAKIFAFALSVVIFCFPTVAMAAGFSNYGDLTAFSVDVSSDGEFELNVPNIEVTQTERIDAAISVFKEVEGHGVIDYLTITKNGVTEPVFSCGPMFVENTENLLDYCYASEGISLEPGQYTYTAQGFLFYPYGEDEFAIDLFKS